LIIVKRSRDILNFARCGSVLGPVRTAKKPPQALEFPPTFTPVLPTFVNVKATKQQPGFPQDRRHPES
jgi:hypothetical protein